MNFLSIWVLANYIKFPFDSLKVFFLNKISLFPFTKDFKNPFPSTWDNLKNNWYRIEFTLIRIIILISFFPLPKHPILQPGSIWKEGKNDDNQLLLWFPNKHFDWLTMHLFHKEYSKQILRKSNYLVRYKSKRGSKNWSPELRKFGIFCFRICFSFDSEIIERLFNPPILINWKHKWTRTGSKGA